MNCIYGLQFLNICLLFYNEEFMGFALVRDSWYAIQVKFNHEMWVASVLQSKGYETFVPVYKSKRLWADRLKVLDRPLFPSYAFCRFDPEIKYTIVSTPNVTRIVGFGKNPVPVDTAEIDSLKIAMISGHSCVPHPVLEIGQKVRVVDGPLTGVKGIMLAEARKKRIVISVALVQKAVAVEVDANSVVVDNAA
jgi:transcription antitermination factor NusG